MRVVTHTTSDTMLRQIQNLSSRQSKLQSQISTGQRITLPEDDPAAVSRVLTLESERRRLTQYNSNAAGALDVAETSYIGLKSLKDTVGRATEVASLSSGVMNPEDMKAYAEEMNQLVEQALQVANTKYNGDSLFAGTKTDAPAFTVVRDATTGEVSSIAYNGNASSVAVPLSDGTAVNPGTTGTTNLGIRDLITQLVGLRDALRSGDTNAVAATQTGLQGSEDTIISAIGQNGGIQSRITAFQQQQTDRLTNVGSLIADEASVDLSTAVVQLSQTTTAYQAALKSASTLLQTSLLDYIK
jgi:flagellar hook-associated protein 3 FlgL